MKKYVKSSTPYRTVSLPNEQYTEIVKHVSEYPQYSSVANFLRQAASEKIRMDLLKLRGYREVENVMGVKAPFDLEAKIKKLEKRMARLEQKKPLNNNFRC